MQETTTPITYRGLTFLVSTAGIDALCDLGDRVAGGETTGDAAAHTVLKGEGFAVGAPDEPLEVAGALDFGLYWQDGDGDFTTDHLFVARRPHADLVAAVTAEIEAGRANRWKFAGIEYLRAHAKPATITESALPEPKFRPGDPVALTETLVLARDTRFPAGTLVSVLDVIHVHAGGRNFFRYDVLFGGTLDGIEFRVEESQIRPDWDEAPAGDAEAVEAGRASALVSAEARENAPDDPGCYFCGLDGHDVNGCPSLREETALRLRRGEGVL